MPKTGEHENKEERKERYRAWLLAHPEDWQDWADAPRGGVERDSIRRALVDDLKGAGILSKTTGWRDVAQLYELLEELAPVRRQGDG